MPKKACKNCKTIYESEKCPECGSKDSVTDFKGKIVVFDPEKSEIAQKISIKKPGTYAIKTK
jgi:DNA-directed RNA polymerase subunit E"